MTCGFTTTTFDSVRVNDKDSKGEGTTGKFFSLSFFCFNYINVLLINRLHMYASTTIVSSCCDEDEDDADQVSTSMNAVGPFIFCIYLDFFPHIYMSGCLKFHYKHSSTYNNAHTLTGTALLLSCELWWLDCGWRRRRSTPRWIEVRCHITIGRQKTGVDNTTTRPTGTTMSSFVWPRHDDDHSIDSPMTATNTTMRRSGRWCFKGFLFMLL